VAAFTYCKSQTFVHRYRNDEVDFKCAVVSRHYHFYAFSKLYLSGDVCRTEVELRLVSREERCVTSAFFFFEDVDFADEVGMRMDGSRFGEDLAAFDVVFACAAEEYSNVVSGFGVVKCLAEHFKAGGYCFLGVSHAYDFNFVAGFDYSSFDSSGYDCAASSDGEDVFYRHDERLVDFTFRIRDVVVACFHEFVYSLGPFVVFVAFKCFERASSDYWHFVSGEVVFLEQVSDFHFDEVEEFRVVDHVAFVHEYDYCRDVDLAGKEKVFSCLGHRSV